jgi:hypothetical protein
MTYSKEQLWEAYKKLPEQLKEYLISDGVTDTIEEIFKENNVSEEKKLGISDLINQVLFRLIPIEDFQEILKTDLAIDKATADTVSQSVNRYVFFPIKEFLQADNDKKAVSNMKDDKTEEAKQNSDMTTKETEETKENDSYRESIE